MTVRAPKTTTSADRLRIAFIYDAIYPFAAGGAERRYHEIASRLAERHEVHTVSWSYVGEASDADLMAPILRHGVGRPPDLYGSDGRRTVGEAARFAWRLLPHLVAGRYDVIDCSATPYVPVYAVWLAARLTRTPLLITWHEVWGDYWNTYLHDRPILARMARMTEARARPLGDAAVAVSPFTARRLAALGHGPAISVVPNGVDLGAIDAAPPVGDTTDVVFVGRLIADKKVDDLLRAVRQLRADRPMRAIIIGDGPERDRLEDLSRSLGLGGSVTFTGRLEEAEVIGRMKMARVLAMPSVREGYGLTVVEAMAAGAVPVVVRAPMSAASDLVTDGVDGLVCEQGPAALATAIRCLLDNESALASMRRSARSVASGHDWSRAAAAMDELYRRFTAGGVSTVARIEANRADA